MKNLKLLIPLLFLALSLSAQNNQTTANEIMLSNTKTTIRIQTSDDNIAQTVLRTDEVDARLQRYTVSFRRDRQGRYREFSFYWKIAEADYVDKLITRLSVMVRKT